MIGRACESVEVRCRSAKERLAVRDSDSRKKTIYCAVRPSSVLKKSVLAACLLIAVSVLSTSGTAQDAPVISGLSPSSGMVGTQVTIYGDYFQPIGIQSVKFGTRGASFTVLNQNSIRTTVPTGSSGTVSVVVTNRNGEPSNSMPFTVTTLQPTTTSLSFSPNPSTYGGNVTFTATVAPSTALGSVTFLSDGVLIGTATFNGTGATITTSLLTAGTHSVHACYAGSANYASSCSTDQNLPVAKAGLAVTANSASRTYGTTNPGFTPSYTGFVNGDSSAVLSGAPTFSTTATASSPVGSYPIIPAQGTLAASNYSFSFVSGSLSITKAPLTVRANDSSRTYGIANPTFSASFSGFLNGDTSAVLTGSPSFSTDATLFSPVGTYIVTPAQGTLAATNYSFLYANGTLTVTRPVPASPTNVSATAEDNSASITLSWASVAYANGYRVQRCTGSQCANFADVADVAAAQFTISDTGLAARTIYNYRVYAYNEVGTSAPSQTAGAMTSQSMSLSTSNVTTYTYDLLGNLESVTNGSQQRTFVYDSYSRLVSATNPEPGTTAYTYDSNGNVLTKTDARGQVISYCYDPLNRLIGKRYAATVDCSSPLTLDIQYTYDVPNGMSPTFPVGRRTGMRDQSGSTAWAYDLVGRVKEEARTIGSVAKNIGFTYNDAGLVESITYPQRDAGGTRWTLNYGYDSAGRPTSVSDGSGTYYASAVTYWPHGPIYQATIGPMTIEDTYQSRLQPATITARTSGSWLINLSYAYGTQNNGNISTITDNIDDSRTKRFTYDALNRIQSFETWTCGNEYKIDARGNLTEFAEYPGKNLCRATLQPVDDNNRLIGHSYDLAGNMTDGGATYDTEGRLGSIAGVTYIYDGDGGRVQKSSGTTYWGGTASAVLSESDAQGAVSSEYVYFAGARIARRDANGSVFYYLADHLGTTQKVIQQDGTACSDIENDPYGNQIATSVNTCPDHYRFNGKERDAETAGLFGDGLDYFGARYFGSSMGRWTSPDWSAMAEPVPYGKLDNPQSLNLYSYVMNNPVSFRDDDGHDSVGLCAENDSECIQSQGGNPSEANKEAAEINAAAPPPPPAPPVVSTTIEGAARLGAVAAAVDAKRHGTEYGGALFQDSNGNYVSSKPRTDRLPDAVGTSDYYIPTPPGMTRVGDWHVQTGGAGSSDNGMHMSDGDLANANTMLNIHGQETKYMINPAGQVWKYNPAVDKKPVLLPGDIFSGAGVR